MSVGCCDTVTWKIQQNDMVKFLQTANGESMRGSTFMVGDHKFHLYVHPNGCNKDRKGSVDLFLELESMPSNVCESRIKLEMLCYETLTSFKWAIVYDSCKAYGWRAFNMRNDECKTKSVTFECNVQILSIKFKAEKGIINTYIGNISQFMPVQLKVATMFEWNINKRYLNVMGTSKPGKQIYSRMFGCWACFCAHSRSKTNTFLFGIQILQVPANISKIKIQYDVVCGQLNLKRIMYGKMSYDSHVSRINAKELTQTVFKSFDALIFKVSIIVKKVYDQDSNEIAKHDWESYGVIMEDKNYNESDEKYETDEMEAFPDINTLQSSVKLIECKHEKLSETVKSLSIGQQLNADNIQSIQYLLQNLNVNVQSIRSDISNIKNDINIIQSKQETDKKIWMLKISELEKFKMEQDIKEDDKKKIVKEWLSSVVGLEQYYDAFVKNGYESLEFIKNIESKTELLEIGIELKGHRTQIWAEIKKLNNKNNIQWHTIEPQSLLLWKCRMCDTMNDVKLLNCTLCGHQKTKLFDDHIEGPNINDTAK